MKIIKNIIQGILSHFNYRVVNKKYLTHHNLPIEANNFEKELIKKSKKFSMTGESRMFMLIKAFEYVKNNKIEGDLVECGVWRGGNLILLQNLLEKYSINKNIYGYDTFEGMTEPSFEDKDYKKNDAKTLMEDEEKQTKIDNTVWCISNKQEVENNIKLNTNSNNISLIRGDVRKTLKISENLPKKISILRLDTDFYDSTKIELETLFPLLSKGGVLIIDDYGHWLGAKKAVDEYFSNKKPWFHVVDYSCRVTIKL